MTDNKKITSSISLDNETWKKIDAFQGENKISSRSKAIGEMIESFDKINEEIDQLKADNRRMFDYILSTPSAPSIPQSTVKVTESIPVVEKKKVSEKAKSAFGGQMPR